MSISASVDAALAGAPGASTAAPAGVSGACSGGDAASRAGGICGVPEEGPDEPAPARETEDSSQQTQKSPDGPTHCEHMKWEHVKRSQGVILS